MLSNSPDRLTFYFWFLNLVYLEPYDPKIMNVEVPQLRGLVRVSMTTEWSLTTTTTQGSRSHNFTLELVVL